MVAATKMKQEKDKEFKNFVFMIFQDGKWVTWDRTQARDYDTAMRWFESRYPKHTAKYKVFQRD